MISSIPAQEQRIRRSMLSRAPWKSPAKAGDLNLEIDIDIPKKPASSRHYIWFGVKRFSRINDTIKES